MNKRKAGRPLLGKKKRVKRSVTLDVDLWNQIKDEAKEKHCSASAMLHDIIVWYYEGRRTSAAPAYAGAQMAEMRDAFAQELHDGKEAIQEVERLKARIAEVARMNREMLRQCSPAEQDDYQRGYADGKATGGQ